MKARKTRREINKKKGNRKGRSRRKKSLVKKINLNKIKGKDRDIIYVLFIIMVIAVIGYILYNYWGMINDSIGSHVFYLPYELLGSIFPQLLQVHTVAFVFSLVVWICIHYIIIKLLLREFPELKDQFF